MKRFECWEHSSISSNRSFVRRPFDWSTNAEFVRFYQIVFDHFPDCLFTSKRRFSAAIEVSKCLQPADSWKICSEVFPRWVWPSIIFWRTFSFSGSASAPGSRFKSRTMSSTSWLYADLSFSSNLIRIGAWKLPWNRKIQVSLYQFLD